MHIVNILKESQVVTMTTLGLSDSKLSFFGMFHLFQILSQILYISSVTL